MSSPIANSGIAATAFELLEQAPIASFADGSARATQAQRAYTRALKICLELADWSFASVLADLNAVDTAALTGFVADTDLAYAYLRPADLLRMRRVEPSWATWRLDRDYVRSDEAGPLRVRYTAMITTEAKLPESFQVAVAFKMATLMPNLVKASSKLDDLKSGADKALAEAAEADRDQQSPERTNDAEYEDDWVTEALQ